MSIEQHRIKFSGFVSALWHPICYSVNVEKDKVDILRYSSQVIILHTPREFSFDASQRLLKDHMAASRCISFAKRTDEALKREGSCVKIDMDWVK